jgi:hypothetical protein
MDRECSVLGIQHRSFRSTPYRVLALQCYEHGPLPEPAGPARWHPSVRRVVGDELTLPSFGGDDHRHASQNLGSAGRARTNVELATDLFDALAHTV